MSNKKFDAEAFIELLSIQAVARNQVDVAEYVKKKLFELQKNVFLTYTEDQTGNILVTKGESECYICLTCHLDTVYVIKKNFQIIVDQTKYSAKAGNEKNGVGGDDKCGIFAILQLLQSSTMPFKAVFFVDEKQNRTGANKIDISFFNDVGFLIAIDRQGKSDMVTTLNFKDITINDNIRDYLMPIARKYGYMETGGKMSNVFTIQSRLKKKAVSAINISCGFFNPISNDEFIEQTALENCIKFISELLQEYKLVTYYLDM